MAKAMRKNLGDIALPAVRKATPGRNIPIDFSMARGRGRGEEAATGARAAEESERGGRVKPAGTTRLGAAGSSRARRAGAGNPGRGHWARAGAAPGCARESRGRRSPPAGSKDGAPPARTQRAVGPARTRRRLLRGEALPLQRPSATAVIRAFQPQMWA